MQQQILEDKGEMPSKLWGKWFESRIPCQPKWSAKCEGKIDIEAFKNSWSLNSMLIYFQKNAQRSIPDTQKEIKEREKHGLPKWSNC